MEQLLKQLSTDNNHTTHIKFICLGLNLLQWSCNAWDLFYSGRVVLRHDGNLAGMRGVNYQIYKYSINLNDVLHSIRLLNTNLYISRFIPFFLFSILFWCDKLILFIHACVSQMKKWGAWKSYYHLGPFSLDYIRKWPVDSMCVQCIWGGF